MSTFFEKWGYPQKFEKSRKQAVSKSGIQTEHIGVDMKDILVETVFGNTLEKLMTLKDAIELLTKANLIDVGELAERAISIKSEVDQCDKNTPNIDLVSGKQVKHAQTNPDNRGKMSNLRAYISIKGITAPILAVVTERVTKKQYFFYFPYKSFSMYSANTFSICFNSYSGEPASGWAWNYEVDSFEKLCELAK
jgi:hypothetical protein